MTEPNRSDPRFRIMTDGAIRRASDVLGMALGVAGLLALLGAFALWATTPSVVLGVEDKPALLSTDHGPRPTTEIVIQPTLDSITARNARVHQALLAAYLGAGLVVGAAVFYGSLRAIARLRDNA